MKNGMQQNKNPKIHIKKHIPQTRILFSKATTLITFFLQKGQNKFALCFGILALSTLFVIIFYYYILLLYINTTNRKKNKKKNYILIPQTGKKIKKKSIIYSSLI